MKISPHNNQPEPRYSVSAVSYAIASLGYGLTNYILSSNYGGWAFSERNTPYDAMLHIVTEDGWRMRTPSELPNPLTNEFLVHLTTAPFFDRSGPDGHAILFDSQTGGDSPGSQYAAAHRNTLISQMIPCTTFATGRNGLLYPETSLPQEQQFDMDAMMKTDANEWPLTDEHKENFIDPPIRSWLHSDIREKAFAHNYKAYKKFVELGNLESPSPP